MKTASKLSDQAAGLLDFLGGTLTPVTDSEPPPAPAPPPVKPKSSGRAAAAAKTTPSAATGSPAKSATKAPGKASAAAAPADVATLAIPDYDGLSATHVVNRLGGLDPDELEAVPPYEATNRGSELRRAPRMSSVWQYV